jgi:CPA1 family monovalent cation:H+ antiporter
MSQAPAAFTQFFCLLLIAFVVAILARRYGAPYALALVVTGLAIGAPRLLPHVHLDPQTLFSVFLPPLLFEAAINLPVGPLRRNGKPIAIYALLGTIASTFIVGGLSAAVMGVPLAIGLVFGALISATDPISVLAVFQRLGALKRLSLIVEAESLFNDGVAAVLFTVTLAAALGGGAPVASQIGQFLWTVIGGTALGAGIGWLASRLHFALDDHLVEITLTTVVAFGSFLAADAARVSGVIAVVAAGLVVGSYGMPNSMSAATRLAVASFWEYAAFVVNSIVFLLIGIEVAYVSWADKAGAVIGAIAAVLVGRAAIYPLSFVANRLKAQIPLRWQHILFWGGLRGALSMALALGLPARFPYRDTLVAATFGVVLFTLLVQGTTIGPLLRRLGLTEPRAQRSQYQRLVVAAHTRAAGLRELERLGATGAYPGWAIELLTEQYRAELSALEQARAALQSDGEKLGESQALNLRRLALLAEKGALNEAQRHDSLEDEDWRLLAVRIDSELAALTSGE